MHWHIIIVRPFWPYFHLTCPNIQVSQHSLLHLQLGPATADSQQLEATPQPPCCLHFGSGCHSSCPSHYCSHEMLRGLIRGVAGSRSEGSRAWSSRQGNRSSPTSLSCASHSRRVSSLALLTSHLGTTQIPNLLSFPQALVHDGCWHHHDQKWGSISCILNWQGVLKGAWRSQVITFGWSISWYI